MLFSDPYLENRLILVGLKETRVNFDSIEDMEGQKIGLVSNYAYDESLMQAENIALVYGNNDQENLEKLFNQKIDLMLVDELLIKYLLQYQYNDVQRYLNIADSPLQTRKLYLAISKETPGAQTILTQFNADIKEMMLDGTYNTILNLETLEMDVNGDGIVELVFNGNVND